LEVVPMIKPNTPSEQLLFATVRIRTKLASGGEGAGTGFFFRIQLDADQTIPVIITNNHVVQGAVTGSFLVHEGRGSPSDCSFEIALDNFEKRWIAHPSPEVDLCAMPFQPLAAEAERNGRFIYRLEFSRDHFPQPEDLDTAMASVTMVGYPNGLWDTANNLPLLRRGVTATHPNVDFCGRPELLVDMACFPGSSGSPVFLLDEGWVVSEGKNIRAGSRLRLLGVLYAGPTMTREGKIVVAPAPTTLGPHVRTELMIHLGYIIKAREISVLGQHLIHTLRELGHLPPRQDVQSLA
jgi:hypothetical protein